MARKIVSKPNTKAADATDPFGNLKDKVGSTHGTKVNALLLSDCMVFFEKMMSEAGIPLNDLPENDVSGFQFMEGLKKIIGHDPDVLTVGTGGAPSFEGLNLASSTSGNSLRFYKIGNEVTIEGSWRYDRSFGGSDLIFVLPVGYRPQLFSNHFPLIDADYSYKAGGILVLSNGNVVFENAGGSIGVVEAFIGSFKFKTP